MSQPCCTAPRIYGVAGVDRLVDDDDIEKLTTKLDMEGLSALSESMLVLGLTREQQREIMLAKVLELSSQQELEWRAKEAKKKAAQAAIEVRGERDVGRSGRSVGRGVGTEEGLGWRAKEAKRAPHSNMCVTIVYKHAFHMHMLRPTLIRHLSLPPECRAARTRAQGGRDARVERRGAAHAGQGGCKVPTGGCGEAGLYLGVADKTVA